MKITRRARLQGRAGWRKTVKACLTPLLLLLLLGCSEDTAEEPDQVTSDVSEFLPGHGPEAPAWTPPPPPSRGDSQRPAPATRASARPGKRVQSAGPITGEVRLAPGATPPASGTLFIIGRMAQHAKAPPMAVKRITAPDFPVTYTLAAEDMMIPNMPFVGKIDVTVRLDADGDASTRQEGDLQGSFAGNPATAGQSGVDITLAAP